MILIYNFRTVSPILSLFFIQIVHLKRFQLVTGHWVKSHKIVNFPSTKFCPTSFLASVPKQAVFNALSNPDSPYHQPNLINGKESENSSSSEGCKKCNNNDIVDSHSGGGHKKNVDSPDCSCAVQKAINFRKSRSDLETRFGSVSSHDGTSDSPQDFHQHRLKQEVNPFDLNYSLYALSVSNVDDCIIISFYLLE